MMGLSFHDDNDKHRNDDDLSNLNLFDSGHHALVSLLLKHK